MLIMPTFVMAFVVAMRTGDKVAGAQAAAAAKPVSPTVREGNPGNWPSLTVGLLTLLRILWN
jgi:hypothetical protein